MANSPMYESIKEYYLASYYTDQDVDFFVQVNWITSDEATTIKSLK